MKKVFGLTLFVLLLVALLPVAAGAQEGVTCAEEVVVQKDDWLSKYADKYYGNVLSWPAIMAWNNQAAAAEPDKYDWIENPDLIIVGWSICVPSAEDADAFLATYDPSKPELLYPGREAEPAAAAGPIKIAVIGKSVHPYWSNVEKGTIAAAKDLGVEAVFFVPPREDVAAQTQTMETYIAQGVTGIAIAPSDPNALESVMKKAADAGIFVTTLDTPPVDDSVSLVYIGTDNYTAGKMAGEAMTSLLPDGGKVGIGRGSDTALNALQRTDGFLEGVAGTGIESLEPVNDKEDAATALQLANSVISANPDLAGAFGVYAYNGPAWATAVKEAGLEDQMVIVAFDATTDIINFIKEGVIDATVAQREYDMGYKSVEIIKMMAEKGVQPALSAMGAVDGVIDTGVDVITPATLLDYESGLDAKGIPHEWDTEGWTPPQ
jgi:ribose transport system substrate-binding protein